MSSYYECQSRYDDVRYDDVRYDDVRYDDVRYDDVRSSISVQCPPSICLQ